MRVVIGYSFIVPGTVVVITSRFSTVNVDNLTAEFPASNGRLVFLDGKKELLCLHFTVPGIERRVSKLRNQNLE